ncbi:trypsin-like serine protease [Streptomyces melanogenes]|uniref:trypsin-like serine protease n=1 Tax=Streptomyces melanogenes TaxID=67326 RepID=UPI00379134A3
MKKLALVATAAASLLAATATVTGPAWSATPTPAIGSHHMGVGATLPAGTQAMYTAQQPLIRLADSLRTIPDTVGSGFGSATIDPPQHSLHLYWKGVIPARVTKLMRSASAQGLSVKVDSAAYTMTELRQETKRIQSLTAQTASPVGARVVGAVMKNDASGMNVDVVGARPAPAIAAGAAVASSVPNLQGAVHLDVHAVDATASQRFDSRGAPTPHYNGGQLLVMGDANAKNGMCTSGFGIRDSSTVNGGAGRRFLLTAAHCGWDDFYTGHQMVHGSASTYIGRTVARNNTDDVQLISTGSDQYVWYGSGIDQDTQPPQHSTTPVSGTGSPYPGEWLCASGAFSGNGSCDVVVDTYAGTGALFATHSYYGGVAAGHGDSGGPAYTSTDGWNTLTAIGVIHGCGGVSGRGCHNMPCPPGYWNNWGTRAGGAGCSSELDLVDLNRALSDLSGTSPINYSVATSDY